MKTLICIACLTCLVCGGLSCGPSAYEPEGEEAISSGPGQDVTGSRVFYFNSFESPEDVLGWEGITAEMFVDDPAPGGGLRSLLIAGDCIQPTAYILFPPSGSAGSYRLSFWGKIHDNVQVGELVLAIDSDIEPREARRLMVAGDEWTFYRTKEPLHLSANQALRLEIMIGGFVSASMSIDCIKIEEIGRRNPQASTGERGAIDASS